MKQISTMILMTMLVCVRTQQAWGQLSGSYTVGTSGYFTTLDGALSRISTDGINGPVTLRLIDPLYDAATVFEGVYKLIGPVSGAGSENRITIRPEDHVAVTIQGSKDAVMLFENVSYVTIDGISRQGDTRLKVHASYDAAFQYNEGILFTGNSDHNIVRRLSAGTDDVTRMSGAIGFWGTSSGASDYCLVEDVFVSSAGLGIYIIGSGMSSNLYRATGNRIRNNQIGSPTDSLIAMGIQDQKADSTIIENNHIQNTRATILSVQNIQCGINTFAGRNTIIRNNLIHDLRIDIAVGKVSGIIASGATTARGNSVRMYNNKVWNISNGSPEVSEVYGITAWYQDSLTIDYNTVVLSETNDTPPSLGSAALFFQSTNFNPIIRNNILVNTRNDTPFVSVAINSNTAVGLSDHNDLFVGPTAGSFVGKLNSENFKTLADWQGTTQDLLSVTQNPLFCTKSLHIDTTTTFSNALDGKGIPLPGILTDYEGAPRHVTNPDIGADEFEKVSTGTAVAEQISRNYFLSQNYPNPFNPSTIIRYALPSAAHVTLTVHDLLGREVATLVNEEQSAGWKELKWNAVACTNGIYFYRLTAGRFVETRKMLLLK